MTNSLRLFLLILIVAAAAQLVLPWWSITPIALVLAFVLGRRGWGLFGLVLRAWDWVGWRWRVGSIFRTKAI
ncbi:hypothetical protein [Hymenobacter radiodurans]|uniref:hypothetical protein n=1 Tax=Hymenobacter radiodurans TaxID=2496028 RepID=UPI0010584737|nr:hypothetical protein [Hymenobacter radiodurans]